MENYENCVNSQKIKHSAIMQSLRLNEVQDQDRNSSCVIPVLLEDCKIPIKLEDFTSSDMTIERDFLLEMRRLASYLHH
jgi:hypothetical protein